MTMLKRIATLLIITTLATLMLATTAFAAASVKKPFKDVTLKTVGKDAFYAIRYVKKHHGLDGVFEGDKLKPQKKILRGEYNKILKNLFGPENVPITEADKKKKKQPITARWAVKKLKAVAEKLGISIRWKNNSKTKLTRSSACQFIRVFTAFDDGEVFSPLR